MKIHDIQRYDDAKRNVEEIEPILAMLDNICEMLYNNIGHIGILRLIEKVEDVRVDYYIKHYEYMQIVKSKGKINDI